MYKIRKIQEKDLNQLSELYNQLVEIPTPMKRLLSIFKKIENKDNFIVFGIFDKEKLIGSVTASKCLDLTGTCQYYYNIENFIVDENYRGKGVGRTLLEYVEQYGRKRNIRYISFVSSIERRKAHTFYNNLGYSEKKVKGFKKIL